MTDLDHSILREYANTFRTCGDLTNKVWFMELEEGGGGSFAQAAKKLCAWKEGGSKSEEYLSGPGSDSTIVNKFFPPAGKQAQLQKTWSNQLRVLLGIQGKELSNESVRQLQTTAHGTAGGPTCLMDLFPLPCKDARSWVYDKVPFDEKVDVNDFTSKKAYYKAYLPRRLDKIKSILSEHKPEALVCMTWNYRDSLVPLLDAYETLDLDLPNCNAEAIIGTCGPTVVVICTHPSVRFRGSRDQFYFKIGNAIRARMNEVSSAS